MKWQRLSPDNVPAEGQSVLIFFVRATTGASEHGFALTTMRYARDGFGHPHPVGWYNTTYNAAPGRVSDWSFEDAPWWTPVEPPDTARD